MISRKSATALRFFALALAIFLSTTRTDAQVQIQTNSPLGLVVLHAFPSVNSLLIGRDGLLYVSVTNPREVVQMTTGGVTNWVSSIPNLLPSSTFSFVQGADGSLYVPGSSITSFSTTGATNWSLPVTNNGDVTGLTVGADGNLYAVSFSGGGKSSGEILAFSSAGSNLWSISSGTTNDAHPNTPLLQGRDGNLYGGTSGEGSGEVFSLSTNGTYNWQFDLTNTGFSGFKRTILQGADGNLYCATTGNQPSVFSLTTNGVLNWMFQSNILDGTLVQGFDGNLYAGGSPAISLTTDGTLRWVSSVNTSLTFVRSDGNLYGFGNTLACLSTNGTLLASQTFLATALSYSEDASGNLFTAVKGGAFELAAQPRLFSLLTNVMVTSQLPATVKLTNAFLGAPPLSLQWLKDGTNLVNTAFVSGARSNLFENFEFNLADSGVYQFVASNAYGVARSALVYIAATNYFGTQISNGRVTLPNVSLFNDRGPSFLTYPIGLFPGRDGDVYGLTAAQMGAQTRIFKYQTNGSVAWTTVSGISRGNAALLPSADDNLLYENLGNAALTMIDSVAGSVDVYGQPGMGFPSLTLASNGIMYGTAYHQLFATYTANAVVWRQSDANSPDWIVAGQDNNLYVSEYYFTNTGGISSFTTNGVLRWSVPLPAAYGAYPNSITQGSDGNLYGTCQGNGSNLLGSVFCATTNGDFLWSFPLNGANGNEPEPALVQAADGYLYGVTTYGGAFNAGTIFRISPQGTDFTTLYTFTGGADGANPPWGLVQFPDGSFYGVAENAGPAGYGTLFRLDMPLANQIPSFQSTSFSNGNLSLTFGIIPGHSYQLQYTTDLSSGLWQNDTASGVATQPVITLNLSPGSAPARFYRLLVQ